MTLLIDSSNPELIKLTIADKQHEFKSNQLSERLLPEIKKFLLKNKLVFSQISEIKVQTDPSHFSRVRTVIAVANALSFALNLKQELILPLYSKAPNITLSK